MRSTSFICMLTNFIYGRHQDLKKENLRKLGSESVGYFRDSDRLRCKSGNETGKVMEASHSLYSKL